MQEDNLPRDPDTLDWEADLCEMMKPDNPVPGYYKATDVLWDCADCEPDTNTDCKTNLPERF